MLAQLDAIEKRLPPSFMSRIFAIHAVLEIHAATEILMTSIQDLLRFFPASLHLKSQQALISYHLRGALALLVSVRQERTSAQSSMTPSAGSTKSSKPTRIASTTSTPIPTFSTSWKNAPNSPRWHRSISRSIVIDPRPAVLSVRLHVFSYIVTIGADVRTGNYYSLRGEHEKAVQYFRRALKLDRGYLSAWTLMGHEYVEMKNTHAAVEAYRRAIGAIRPLDLSWRWRNSSAHRRQPQRLSSVVWTRTDVRAARYARLRAFVLSACDGVEVRFARVAFVDPFEPEFQAV